MMLSILLLRCHCAAQVCERLMASAVWISKENVCLKILPQIFTPVSVLFSFAPQWPFPPSIAEAKVRAGVRTRNRVGPVSDVVSSCVLLPSDTLAATAEIDRSVESNHVWLRSRRISHVKPHTCIESTQAPLVSRTPPVPEAGPEETLSTPVDGSEP